MEVEVELEGDMEIEVEMETNRKHLTPPAQTRARACPSLTLIDGSPKSLVLGATQTGPGAASSAGRWRLGWRR